MGRVRRSNLGLRTAAATVLLAGLACTPRGGSTTPGGSTAAPNAAQPEAASELPPFEAFLVGRADGSTTDEARAAALLDLEQAFLGSAGWSDARHVSLHDPARDPMRVSESDVGVRVELGLSEGRAAALLSELELSPLQLEGPADWQDTIRAAVLAQTAATVCLRRAELFTLPCDPPDTTESASGLAALGAGIAVTPIFPDGIPLDGDGQRLRAGGVFVFWHGNPVANVPLIGTTADGRAMQRLSTDRNGRAELPPAVNVEPNMRVKLELDVAALLGPIQVDWPTQAVEVGARPLDHQRFTVLSNADSGPSRDFVTSLRSALAPSMGGAGVTLPLSTVRELQSTREGARQSRIGQAADAARGALDFILFATATDRFANRAGGGRVWYEATGSVDVRNAWSGETFATIDKTVTANGVGHDRARSAARRQLATELAAAVAKKLGGAPQGKPETAMLRAPN